MGPTKALLFIFIASAGAACASANPPQTDFVFVPIPEVVAIHEQSVFADMHAHPSRFHRENVESIAAAEIDVYRRSSVDLVVANISSDMAYDGEYTNRDGTVVGDVGKVMGANFFRVWQAVR